MARPNFLNIHPTWSDDDQACYALLEQEIQRISRSISMLQRKLQSYERMKETWGPMRVSQYAGTIQRPGVYYPSLSQYYNQRQ